MNKIFTGIFILFVVLIGFSSCKKYEDGPYLSFRSTNQRITNTWKIESLTINGVEQVGQPQYSTQVQFWLPDGQYNHTYINPTNGIAERVDGTWELQEDKEKIALNKKSSTTGLPQTGELYNILKLYEKCMWIRSVDNSTEYHLVPANK